MRILTIIDDLSVGGRQRAAQEYALGYHRNGYASAVLTLLGGGPRQAELSKEGLPVFVGSSAKGTLAEAIRNAAAWGPDTLHLHSEGPVRPFEAEAIRRLRDAIPQRIPVIETSSFGKVDYAHTYTETDVHLLMSRWALWRWRRWSRPFRPPPVGALVPITVNPSAFYPAPTEATAAYRQRWGIPREAVLFGCIARPDPVKWPPSLFRAFEAVALRCPEVYLVVAGLTPSARRELDDLSPTARLRVVELPFIEGDDELRLCYSALDVFLHASTIGESFGLVLIEAMACETPVITVNTPHKNNSQVEVVGHGRGGLVANNTRAYAAAMERLATNAPLRQRLGRQGREHVLARYTPSQVVPMLLRIASLAHQATERASLAEMLARDPDLITHVADDEILAMMGRSQGQLPVHHRVLRHLVHQPALFRLWRRFRA